MITRFVRWLKRRKKKRRALFYKALLVCIEVYAMAMLGMSYYLAYIGRDVVLEELSRTIVKVLVYPFEQAKAVGIFTFSDKITAVIYKDNPEPLVITINEL